MPNAETEEHRPGMGTQQTTATAAAMTLPSRIPPAPLFVRQSLLPPQNLCPPADAPPLASVSAGGYSFWQRTRLCRANWRAGGMRLAGVIGGPHHDADVLFPVRRRESRQAGRDGTRGGRGGASGGQGGARSGGTSGRQAGVGQNERRAERDKAIEAVGRTGAGRVERRTGEGWGVADERRAGRNGNG